MWKDIKYVLRLTDEMQAVKSDIKDLEKRSEATDNTISRLSHRIDRLEEKYNM